MSQFQEGQVIWARMKGHPCWPAVINSQNAAENNTNIGKWSVTFLGTGEVGTFKHVDMLDYHKNASKFEQPRKIKGFNNAVRDAHIRLGTLTNEIKARFPLTATSARPRSRKNTLVEADIKPDIGPRSRKNSNQFPPSTTMYQKRGRRESVGSNEGTRPKRSKHSSVSSATGGPVVLHDVSLMAAIEEIDPDVLSAADLFPMSPTNDELPVEREQQPKRSRRLSHKYEYQQQQLHQHEMKASPLIDFGIQTVDEIQVPCCPKCHSAGRLASDDGKAIIRCMATNCRKKFYRFNDARPADLVLKQFMMNKVTKPTRLKLAEAVDLKQVPMTPSEKAQMKAERLNAQTRSLTPQRGFRHDVISVPHFQARLLEAASLTRGASTSSQDMLIASSHAPSTSSKKKSKRATAEDVKPSGRQTTAGVKLKTKARNRSRVRSTSGAAVVLPSVRAYYHNSQAELCVRPWLGKRLRNSYIRHTMQGSRPMSPPRPYGHTALDAAAATRQSSRTLARMGEQVLKETMRESHGGQSAASITANASSSVGGTIDLLLDTFMATLGPLSTIAQHLTPAHEHVQGRRAVPVQLLEEIWTSTIQHTPQNR